MKRVSQINHASPLTRIEARQMPEFLPDSVGEGIKHWMHPDIQMQVYTHRSVTHSIVVPAVAEPLLVWVLSGRARIQEREAGAQWTTSDVAADDFFLTMADEPYEMRWQTMGAAEFRVVHLYLSRRLLEQAATEVLGGQASLVRLKELSGAHDPRVALLVRELYEEFVRLPVPSLLYAGGLAQALAVHLVRMYRADEPGLKPANALPAYRLQRVIKRMQASLDTAFNLSVFAAEAGLGDYYFSRLFHRATGHSPSQYFIQLRLAKARHLLLHTPMTIIEVALEVGYASAGHFAQVFRRHMGMTPRDYRQR